MTSLITPRALFYPIFPKSCSQGVFQDLIVGGVCRAQGGGPAWYWVGLDLTSPPPHTHDRGLETNTIRHDWRV